MPFTRLINAFSSSRNKPRIVIFAGGLGAQIINAAVYLSIKNAGQPVFADLSYFDEPENVAVVGKPGDCSHWKWMLLPFGLSPASFECPPPSITKHNSNILQDGVEMMELGLEALAQPKIQEVLKLSSSINDTLPFSLPTNFLCMHVRRGDFVNVASHLVADEEFFSLVKKFSNLVSHAVVISDSPIGVDFRNTVSSYFNKVFFLDNNIDAHIAHHTMRSARILICSNSTFSLTAAALNPNALVIIPKQWYGGKHRQIEEPIHSRCAFQILENEAHK